MRLVFIILLSGILFIVNGCNIINPKEDLPSYVKVDSFSVAAQAGDSFGSPTQKIVGFRGFYNGSTLGSFDFPATVPYYLGDGGTLTLAPLIDMNGLSQYMIYPFYDYTTVNVTKDNEGKVLNYQPVTRYRSDAKMVFYTNFENGVYDNNFIKAVGDSSLVKTQDPKYVFQGQSSGFIYLNGPDQEAQVVSTRSFQLTPGTDAFLEIDYKCNTPFWVGLYTSNTSFTQPYEYSIGVGEKADWNKMYVNLNFNIDNINFITGANSVYFVVIYAITGSDQSSGWVAIDNIKVMTF